MKPRKHLTFILFVCLCAFPSVYAQNQSDIVDRLNKALGVTLPSDYQQQVKTFVQTNTVLKNQGRADFTENFIKDEMAKDWNIEKQNQLLFIWHAIYKQITADDLYKGDGNNKIADDFNSRTVNVRIRACGQKYENQVVAFMKQQSAEAKQQSAEATLQGLNNLKKFYVFYIDNANSVKLNDIEEFREHAQWIIPNCKKYDIDYRAILLKELGDQKKVDDLLKFYGVE